MHGTIYKDIIIINKDEIFQDIFCTQITNN
jgi:hypothetical protein